MKAVEIEQVDRVVRVLERRVASVSEDYSRRIRDLGVGAVASHYDLRGEIRNLRYELKDEIGDLRYEIRKAMTELRYELMSEMNDIRYRQRGR